MTVRLEAFASLDAVPADAEALFAASSGLFASPAWWRTVLSFGMPPRTHACFLLARIDDRPVALLPLRQDDASGTLGSLTTPYTCVYTPLVAADLPVATLVPVFAALARFCRGHAITRFDALPEEWAALPAFEQGAREAGLSVVRFAHFGNWHETVDGMSWSGYLAARPGALRETIRRKLRRADQRSDASLAVVAGPPDLEAGIDAFEHVYARSWKQPEPFPLFNAALMRETAAAGRLRLGLWHIGGVAVAAQFWIMEAGTATVLKLAHDEAFHADSPGTVLTALMLRRFLDEEHIAAIDFGRGDDAYKQGWAKQRRQRIGVVLVDPHRPAGLVFLARHALGRMRMSLRSRSMPVHVTRTQRTRTETGAQQAITLSPRACARSGRANACC